MAREGFIIFFSEVFDAMFRLCADSDSNVMNAVTFLDNLVKARWAGRGRGCCFGFMLWAYPAQHCGSKPQAS